MSNKLAQEELNFKFEEAADLPWETSEHGCYYKVMCYWEKYNKYVEICDPHFKPLAERIVADHNAIVGEPNTLNSIIRLIDKAIVIFESTDINWEETYDQIFDMMIWKKIRDAGYYFDWFDPDTSYQEDVTYYVNALKEFKATHNPTDEATRPPNSKKVY